MVRKAPTLTKRRESDAEPGRSPSEFDDSGIGLEARPRGTPAPSTTGPPLAYIYSSVLVALLALVVYPRLAKIAELDGALVRLQGQYDDLQQRVASTATTTADMISQQNLLLKVRQLELQINDRLLGLETRMEQLKTRVGNDERTGFQDLNAAPDADQLHEALHRLERDQQSAVQNLQQQLQLLASRYGPHSNLTETLEKRYGRCEERLRRLETSLIQNQTGIITVQTSDAVDVRRIVNRLLYRHMADGTERVDYALESVGGKVLASSGVHHANGWSQIAHLLTLTPSTYAMGHIIRPSMQLSDCWPMPGSSGWIVLELSASILVDAVTVEHVAPETAPQFRLKQSASSTAPKQFRVAVLCGDRYEAIGMGEYRRAVPEADPGLVQTFAMGPAPCSSRHVNVTIESNHGDSVYTCLYRFRVHGQPQTNTVAAVLA